MKSLVTAFVACGLLVALPMTATAQIRGAGSKIRGQDYNFYTGSSYNRHAADHSRVLSYYSSVEEPIPSEVAKQHATAIRKNVEASKSSYAALKKATADNKGAQEQLATIDQHHKAALAAVDKLDAHCTKDEAHHGDVAGCCADIHKELAAADEAAAKLQKELKLEKLPAPAKK